MKKRYKRYKWNLFGKHCGLNIIGRLKWINGKPMVYVTLLVIYFMSAESLLRDTIGIPGAAILFAHWGWKLCKVISKIAFVMLFLDGVTTRFLFTFTRGSYKNSFLMTRLKKSNKFVYEDVRDDIAWACFLFTHREFDNRLQKLKKMYLLRKDNLGEEIYAAGYNDEVKALRREFMVNQDNKGRYYSLNDKKYKKLLEEL